MEFKEGDRILVKKRPVEWSSSLYGKYPLDLKYPREFIITKIQRHDRWDSLLTEDGYGLSSSSLEEISEIIKTKNKTMIQNLKENFILALTSEPKKSFRKAGITNGDDILTDDGAKVFLSWLLHSKYANEFKADVVDEMLKEEK